MMVQCDRCSAKVEPGETREYGGRNLCDDCYMDALSPVRTCDPWAVHSAKSLELHGGSDLALTEVQAEILAVLEQTGGIERVALVDHFAGRLTQSEIEREFAALRHMEKARAEKREDKVFLRVW